MAWNSGVLVGGGTAREITFLASDPSPLCTSSAIGSPWLSSFISDLFVSYPLDLAVSQPKMAASVRDAVIDAWKNGQRSPVSYYSSWVSEWIKVEHDSVMPSAWAVEGGPGGCIWQADQNDATLW